MTDGYFNDYDEYTPDGDRIDFHESTIRRLKLHLRVIELQQKKEESLRAKHKALNEAYEQYQTILKLVDNA